MVVREKASLAGRASRFPFLSTSIAVVVLSLAAALAGFIPARRAASIEPMEALRND
jgi:ABC-type antimicrobial peptide transport system permease subunit